MKNSKGTLVLIIGPSGSGKDSLILEAKKLLASDPQVAFPRRLITRPFYPGAEDYVSISQQDFAVLKTKGEFLLSWHAHGLDYGIPSSVKSELEQGKKVVINVSREVVAQAKGLFPGQVKVVKITAPKEIIRERLLKRGREKPAEIEERLNREFSLAGDIEIDNSGDLEIAAAKLVAVLLS